MNPIKNPQVSIIAGPCSISERNFKDLYELSSMEVKNREGNAQRAIAGVRIVGVKSRTSYSYNKGSMGLDSEVLVENIEIYAQGGGVKDMKMLPSVQMAQEYIRKTNMMVASEIVSPLIQIPLCDKLLKEYELLLWTPAVAQLGWNLLEMYEASKENKWTLGVKNPKWVGKETDGLTSMEKTWLGMGSYVPYIHKVIFIQRGVDVAESGLYRNLPVHESAKKIKKASGMKMYFDPSHCYGPKLRDKIVEGTIEAMKMKLSDNEYLYDGILIEAGVSETDTEQHITHKELQQLAKSIAEFRDIVAPADKKVVAEVSRTNGIK
jgi:3-deoxy-D-arabino-heptulosonate 7-phosphate (DAHP) synthase